MAGQDHYQVLGVAPNATLDLIRAAYKRAARECHPNGMPADSADVPRCTKKFQDVKNAYDTLSDPIARQKYDQTRYVFNQAYPGPTPAPRSTSDQFDAVQSAYDQIPLIIGVEFWSRFDPNVCTQQCLGNTLQRRQCRNRKRGNPRLVDCLQALDPARHPEKSRTLIIEFLYERFCYHHCGAVAEKARVYKFAPMPYRPNTSPEPKHEFKHGTPAPSPQQSSSQRTTGHPGLRSDPLAREEVKTQSSRKENVSTLKRYTNVQWTGEPVSHIIRETLFKSFKNGLSGQLYIYTSASAPGYCKIGRTVRDPGVRIAEWASQCKQDIKLESTTEPHVPAVEQLERLVFAELYPDRHYEAECRACGRKHVEWFRVSPAHARRVTAKWAAFLQAAPYEFCPGSSLWVLPNTLRESNSLNVLYTPLSANDNRSPQDIALEIKAAIAAVRSKSAAESEEEDKSTEEDSENETANVACPSVDTPVNEEPKATEIEEPSTSKSEKPSASQPPELAPLRAEMDHLMSVMEKMLARMTSIQAEYQRCESWLARPAFNAGCA